MCILFVFLIYDRAGFAPATFQSKDSEAKRSFFFLFDLLKKHKRPGTFAPTIHTLSILHVVNSKGGGEQKIK